ncbi:dyslexia-associated protein KIAA0319 homolog isoform X2 [Lutra lutra]|uniref:dyslexia-associated protein KIAA0319 homolog isoform X2 n=1 Tax=Lutra lutra TaxID=9657 RepID=UPI001FD4D332|nr:dyslexia-associated protein KIAA0319 homolog isoform X2 [Lutra lutra]
MAPPTSVFSSLLLLATVAGCACGPCSEGRTFANAVISPNLETTQIAWVPQTSPVADCTAACCDLALCDLAWWFEGRCYLVSCPRSESCEPREMGSVRSYLTFVRRPARRPSQLLRYREMVLRRRSPSGLWGDSPEGLRKDLSPLGPALRLRRASEYSDDYRDPEQDPFQPLSKQEPRGSAEYTDWGLFPGGPSAGDGLPWAAEEQKDPEWGPEETLEYSDDYRDPEQDPFQPLSKQEPRGSAEYPDWGLFPGGPSAGDGLPGATQEQKDPVLRPLNGSARTPAPKRSSESRTSLPWVTAPPSREALGKETVGLQDAPSSGSGEEGRSLSGSFCNFPACTSEVLMPSRHPSPARLEFSPASTEESPLLTVPTRSPDHGAPTRPASLIPAEPTPSEQPASPTTASRTVKELLVWAGENRIVTLPEREVELKASVVPAPPAETTYSYEWSLVSHPGDYREEIKERHMQTLNLSHLSAGLYAFKVAVSSDSAFGEGFVNVTVKPARRVNLPPTAVVSPQMQALTLPLMSAFIDGSQSTDDTKIVSYRWEEISGPSREEKTPADSPVLHLSNLIPGNYTFRLTVTDSDGATNSTTAALIVNSAVDHPPVANAGPDQTITLPQNSITLNGNQSSDDHQIVVYEWSLGPGSESKEVAMQEGDYTFQLTVTDSSKQQSTAMVTVTVQPESNRPPVAVPGPDKELIFSVESTTLDGSRSTDDQGIALSHWEHVRGPGARQVDGPDEAIDAVRALQAGARRSRVTVTNLQGLSGTSALTTAVRKANNSPPRAHAGGHRVLVLPSNGITLDGSRSTDDQGVVSYLWVRDGQSPAAGDVISGSDRSAALQLTNLVEGVYTFRLQVVDGQGASDTDTATVEVRPDPRKSALVELILQVGVGQLTEQQKDTLVRRLAALLNVLDSDVKVQKIQAHSDFSTIIVFYIQSGPPFKVLKAADVVRNLHRRLSKEKADFLLFKVLRIDTAGCLLRCSGHGHCDPITKRCVCSQLWMENLIQRYLQDGESNCEWSVFYVAALALTVLGLTGGVPWLCLYCRRRKRTKIRKKTKYTILDSVDEQERMELRPKRGIKHRSTEHNSSLMVSESEFDSDQDTIFSRERMERGNPKVSVNGSLRNGSPFSYCSKDR